MKGKVALLSVTLALLLAAAVALSYFVWTSTDAKMSTNGMAALILGALGSLIVGGGLMALVFLSARRGYDDAADAANQSVRADRDSSEP